MKKRMLFAKWLGKMVCAGLLSLCLLILFGCFYYAGSSTYSGHGITDYAWRPNRWFVFGNNEGYSFGRWDPNGYNNTYTDEIDQMNVSVVLMGSSHVEGINVWPTENMTYQLNVLMNEVDQDFYAYNVGLSGYQTHRCITNLEAVCRAFAPRQAIFIEAHPLDFDVDEMQMALDGTLPPMMPEQSVLKQMMVNIPYLQLLGSRLQTNIQNLFQNEEREREEDGVWVPEEYSSVLERLLKQALQITSQYGCELVLFYHPHLLVQTDGSTVPDYDPQRLALYKSVCEENGITFVDMTDTFMEAYETDHILPHGFANTEVGVGHLNRHGHRMIAQELAKVLEDMEGNI